MGVKKMMDGYYHYDFSGLMGSKSPINAVVGGRTLGKTFQANYIAMKHFITRGEQFAFVVRYDTQLSPFMARPGSDAVLNAGYFQGWNFRGRGDVFECRKGSKGKWKTCGYGFALTKFDEYKKQSFPGVTKIFFDEFIKSSPLPPYLRGEVDMFTNLWSTVARRRSNCRCYLMANNVSLSNPYFQAWGVILPGPGKTKTFKVGLSSVTVENCYKDEFVKEVQDDAVSRFLYGSEQAEMALYNKHVADGLPNSRRPKGSECIAHFILDRKHVGVWSGRGGYWVSEKWSDWSGPPLILFSRDQAPGTVQVTRASKTLKMLTRAHNWGGLFYESDNARYIFQVAQIGRAHV